MNFLDKSGELACRGTSSPSLLWYTPLWLMGKTTAQNNHEQSNRNYITDILHGSFQLFWSFCFLILTRRRLTNVPNLTSTDRHRLLEINFHEWYAVARPSHHHVYAAWTLEPVPSLLVIQCQRKPSALASLMNNVSKICKLNDIVKSNNLIEIVKIIFIKYLSQQIII